MMILSFGIHPTRKSVFSLFIQSCNQKAPVTNLAVFLQNLKPKLIPVINITVPGVITLGTLSIDIAAGTYAINGGVPISDIPRT